MTYTITLQDAPAEITERAQREAEERFRRTLERALGGPDAVLAAHRAWQAVEDTAESEMSAEDTRFGLWMPALHRDILPDPAVKRSGGPEVRQKALNVLMQIRLVVESEIDFKEKVGLLDSIQSDVTAMHALVAAKAFQPKRSLRGYFYPRFVDTLPKLGQAACDQLWAAGVRTPQQILEAKPGQLESIKGIGLKVLAGIIKKCQSAHGPNEEYVDRSRAL